MEDININLHPKQSQCFLSEATEILYGGAAGAAKSFLLRAKAIAMASQIPHLQVYLLRRISEDLISNHFEGPGGFNDLLAPWIDSGFCKITHKPSNIRFANGSTIYARHCQLEKHKYSFQGKEIHVLLIDELTHFTDSQYRYIRGRCRVPKDERILKSVKELSEKLGRKIKLPLVICGSNPGGLSHNTVKQAFIDPAKPYEIVKQTKEEGGMLRQYIPALLLDNPSLDPVEYAEKLAGLGNPELVKAMLEGSWDIVAGGMFDDLWRTKTHVIAPFAIPKTWYFDRTFDWGSSAPFAVCWWAESDGCDVVLKDGSIMHTKNGDVFLFAELYGWNGKANQGCRMLAADVAKKIVKIEKNFPFKINPGPADNSINARDNDNCIADDMLRMGVRWTEANKNPGSIAQGCEQIRKHLQGAIDRENKGVFIFDTCRHSIRTIPTLPRDDKKPDQYDSNAEDHLADCWRYKLLAKKQTVKMGRVVGLGG